MAQKSIAEAINAEIELRQISPAEAARIMGVSEANVSRWRTGGKVSKTFRSALISFLRTEESDFAMMSMRTEDLQWERKQQTGK